MKFSCKALILYLSQEILIFSCKVQFLENYETCKKQKLHIYCEKVAQINISAHKIVT